MNKLLSFLSTVILIITVSPVINACGFHGGFDAPSPYGWNLRTYDDQEVDPVPVTLKKKPVFSTAATRASDSAKAKIKTESDDKENQEQQSDNNESLEKSSNKELESKVSL